MGFWRNKRTVVTGGAGFLGGAVVRELRDRGCRNVIVPRRREFDLRTSRAVKRLFEKARPDVVIHLAARVGGIGANQAEPGSFFYDNLIMGAELMEQSRRFGLEKFVGVGTVCAYPKFAAVPFKEEDLWTGYPEETNAPYALAKKMLLVQSQAYRKQYGFNSIFLLPANLYGPGQDADEETSHVIPALIRKCLDAKRRGRAAITAWGTGKATREFLYVDDAARGIVLAGEKYDDPEPVNIGAGAEISIADLAELVARLTGFRGAVAWDASRPDGQPRRRLDVARARKRFGFTAKVGLKAGLRKTVNWYVGNRP